MPLANNREQITVSGEAHKHLRNVVAEMKKKGIPTNGTVLASEALLSIPLPDTFPLPQITQPKKHQRRARKAAHQAQPATAG